MTRRTKSRGAGDEGRGLSIGALSMATRIPVETLRTWEHRYGSPKPMRKPSGHRVYEPEAVDRLRRVGRLLAQGHRPAEVLPLSTRELDELLALASPAARQAPWPGEAGLAGEHDVGRMLEALLRAARTLDRESMTQELQSAWARLGPVRFLEEVAGGFLARLGQAWREGQLQVHHEHFASGTMLDFLRGVREPFDRQARGPRVVVSTLPGERHEGGLVLTSVLMAVRGCRVANLGLDTPLDQIVAAATALHAEAVAVSISAAGDRASAARDVAALRAALPRRVALWIGGAGAPEATGRVDAFASLADLDQQLRSLA